ncbi:MAG: hypothetical protein GYB67_17780 [Chloroflexi bacterium]|nr:hypothetical protein [Chloroflexota bacterium]
MRKALPLLLITLLLTVNGLFAQRDPDEALGVGFITFVSDLGGNEDIYVIDTTGNNLFNLTANPARDWHPDWSPDGREIVFTSNRDGSADLYVMNANGSDPRPLLTTPDVDEGAPAWSPDGDRIAFVANSSDAPEIFVLTISESTVNQITDDGLPKGAPTWSPDGQMIAFWRTEGDNNTIVAVDSRSGIETILVAAGANNWPAYAPSGDQLAFFRVEGGAAKLLALDLTDDSDDTIYVLSEVAAEFSDLQPSWSPTGQRLVFTSNRSGQFQIYTQVAFGAGTGFGTFPQRLVSLDAAAHSPEWQPVPVVIDFSGSTDGSLPNTFRVTQNISPEDNLQLGGGELAIFAPEQMASDEVIRVRLELSTEALLNAAADATPTPAALDLPTPRALRPLPVYQYMGAELQGFDIDDFETFPNPNNYVIQVDPNIVNYWEWQLRPVNLEISGRKSLVATVYLPEETRDGAVGRFELLREAFTIEVVAGQPQAQVSNAQQVIPPIEPPSANDAQVRLVYNNPNLYTLIVLQETNLGGVTIASSLSEISVMDTFDVLQLSDGVALAEICLHYVRFDAPAPVPALCNNLQNFRTELNPADVFWYDVNQASVIATVVRREADQTTIAFCAGGEQPGCDF